jgi:maleamate amidohydrolase
MTSDEIYRTQQFGQRIGFGSGRRCWLSTSSTASPIRDCWAEATYDRGRGSTVGFFPRAEISGHFHPLVYAEDGSDAGLWCEKAPRMRLLTESADANQVLSELAPRAGEFVVRKTQASAFFGAHLGSVLTGRAIDTPICSRSGG